MSRFFSFFFREAHSNVWRKIREISNFGRRKIRGCKPGSVTYQFFYTTKSINAICSHINQVCFQNSLYMNQVCIQDSLLSRFDCIPILGSTNDSQNLYIIEAIWIPPIVRKRHLCLLCDSFQDNCMDVKEVPFIFQYEIPCSFSAGFKFFEKTNANSYVYIDKM